MHNFFVLMVPIMGIAGLLWVLLMPWPWWFVPVPAYGFMAAVILSIATLPRKE